MGVGEERQGLKRNGDRDNVSRFLGHCCGPCPPERAQNPPFPHSQRLQNEDRVRYNGYHQNVYPDAAGDGSEDDGAHQGYSGLPGRSPALGDLDEIGGLAGM
jgi:hypothetical protein